MTSRTLAIAAVVAWTGAVGAQTIPPAAPVVPLATTPAVAIQPGDPENGATIFKKCSACHQIGPTAKNSIGPVLNGVVGRMAGTYPSYAYSDANKKSGITWTEAMLAAYLPAPMMFLPGTKMTFAGLKNPQDVADVISYLKLYDAAGNKASP